MYKTIILVLILNLNLIKCDKPEQVHLSFGDTISEIFVTWSTRTNSKSIVEYGTTILNLKTFGNSNLFQAGENNTEYIHRVKLTSLEPDTQYKYRVSGNNCWSEIFWFNSVPTDENWSPRLAVYGDLGVIDGVSIPYLRYESKRGEFDAIFHLGDIAYDLETDNGTRGDIFMNEIQSIAAYTPYMTCVGNHEQLNNFTHYKNRFTMPGGSDKLMYSLNLGPAHIIVFNTEVYYFLKYGEELIEYLYEQLEADLIKANDNRAIRPWIITMTHRPMYCDDPKIWDDYKECEGNNSVSQGLNGYPGLEVLFNKYQVDLYLSGHKHVYERFWPVFNFTAYYDDSNKQVYNNPKAMVHIITGAAGTELKGGFSSVMWDFSAQWSLERGYSILNILNKTHLNLQQISVERNLVIDDFWIIKNL